MTSASDKLSTSSSSSSSSTSSREVDPLLKDLSEKKQNFRRSVVSLASELKDVRARLASQQNSFAKEALTRQEAENRVKDMESEMNRLKRNVEEKDLQLKASTSAAEIYIKELDELSLALSATKETAHASSLAARSAQLQCSSLAKELEEKDTLLKEHETRVNKLEEQLNLLQKDLHSRELSQMQLKEEVLRIEHEIMQSLTKAGAKKDCELRRILDEVSPKNFERINKLLSIKDDEIAKLRDEIRIMSGHWKLKMKEMESQLEKQRRVDQELKKKVLRLEFCLQEARSQTRKLQRMGERRDKALKELKDQLVAKQQNVATNNENNQNSNSNNIWESSGFKIVVSMSMLILVIFSKR